MCVFVVSLRDLGLGERPLRRPYPHELTRIVAQFSHLWRINIFQPLSNGFHRRMFLPEHVLGLIPYFQALHEEQGNGASRAGRAYPRPRKPDAAFGSTRTRCRHHFAPGAKGPCHNPNTIIAVSSLPRLKQNVYFRSALHVYYHPLTLQLFAER